MSERSFSTEEMAWLRSTTTIFYLRPQDVPFRAKYEAALTSAWTLTPLKVVPFEERGNYTDHNKYSYFIISGEDVTVTNDRPNLSYRNTRVYLTLLRITGEEDGVLQGTAYCRIDLHTDFSTMARVQADGADGAIARVYSQGIIRNWSPAQLFLYVRDAQRELNDSRRRWEFEELSNEGELARLKTATLYVPDYALIRYSPFTGDESERHAPKELFASYPYKYKIVTAAELDGAMVNSAEPVYVFDFVRSASDKFVAVYERKAGLVYRSYSSTSYNVDSDDFELF